MSYCRETELLTPPQILLRIKELDMEVSQMKSRRALLDESIRERESKKHRLKSLLAMSSVESLASAG
jgi:hypothetical protein